MAGNNAEKIIQTNQIGRNTQEERENLLEETKTKWFNQLKDDIKPKEATEKIIDSLSSYFDLKLSLKLSLKERDNIKLILLWEVIENLDLWKITKDFVLRALKPLKELITSSTPDDTKTDIAKQTSEFEEKIEVFRGAFNNLWIDAQVKEIEKKIDTINKEKEENSDKEFSTLSSVLWVIDSDWEKKSEGQIYNDVKQSALKLSKWTNKWSEFVTDIKAWYGKLPDNIKEVIQKVLETLKKEFPIIWALLSLFFWEWFFEEVENKESKSIKDLQAFSEKEEFPFKNNIKPEELKNLDPKELETFFKYLKDNKINYKDWKFWQELLTWDTKDPKIKELFNLLTHNNKPILSNNEKIKDFIYKLNDLSGKEKWINEQKRLESNKEAKDRKLAEIAEKEKFEEQKRIIKEIQEAKDQEAKDLIIEKEKANLIALWVNGNNLSKDVLQKQILEIDVAIQDKENAILLAEGQIEKSFAEYLKDWKIKVNWELKSISINSNTKTLTIWENDYKISIMPDAGFLNMFAWWDKLDKISFVDWVITIKAWKETEVYKAEESEDILKSLIANDEYKSKIKWQPANFIIEKVS